MTRHRSAAPAEAAATDADAQAFATALTSHTTNAADPSADVGARADVCTVTEVARWLGVNRKTVYEAVDRREIPCARLGRRVIMSRAAITAWLAGRLP